MHTFDAAARYADIETMEWLREEGCPWGTSTCCSAAARPNPAHLQWLHAHGCPWDYHTAAAAAGAGSPDTLEWAVANGCPWELFMCMAYAPGLEGQALCRRLAKTHPPTVEFNLALLRD